MNTKKLSNKKVFDEHHVIHELKHYLPTQTPLKDFIHHNTLHAFQDMKFYDAIFKAAEIFGFEVTFPVDDYRELYRNGRIGESILNKIIKDRKGEKNFDFWKNIVLHKPYEYAFAPRVGRLRANWKAIYHLDLDTLVQPLLFRILSSYLDQGVAIWHFPNEDKGLLYAIKDLEKNSSASFFKSKRTKQLLFNENTSIKSLLDIIVGEEEYYEQYIFDQQCSHRGWSGMVSTIEDQPDSVLYKKKIALKDLIILDLLFEIDALDTQLGDNWQALAKDVKDAPIDLFAEVASSEMHEVLMIWQDAFEWNYYDEVMAGVSVARENRKCDFMNKKPSFQSVFCIDDRECSIRRYIEFVDEKAETLGCPGFFGVEFFFQPEGSKFYDKLCPLPVTPKYLVKEGFANRKFKKDILQSKQTHKSSLGFFMALSLGVWAAIKVLINLFRPQKPSNIPNTFNQMDMRSELIIEYSGHSENGLQIGFKIEEMALRVENLLKNIGLIGEFAPLVYLVSHGSSTVNNPYHRAYDCGACSGRNGSVNARVFSFMANHPEVRAILAKNGLIIPDETQFVGALHDTASDEIVFYDISNLSPKNTANHLKNKDCFENALDLNAKERSRRFASIDTKQDIKKVHEAIRRRSVSLFEPRPELGHGTNALCFVGHRNLTKNMFLDRRAFMNSYDYRTDLEGKLLLGVMRPLPPVCGGINLEYYFSRMDNYKLGAGTKLPHNIVGLIGVANSSDGDLRPGLPLQMIEVHDPVRLMILVEHYPDVVLKTIQTEPSLYEWFINDWVRLTAIHPETNEFYFFKDGAFTQYTPLNEKVNTIGEIHSFLEEATSKEMKTNYIGHATHENLPVQVIK